MVFKYYGKHIPIQTIRQLANTNREGASMLQLSKVSEQLGVRSKGVLLSWEQLKSVNLFPVIVFWGDNHFIVATKIRGNKITVADPALGMRTLKAVEFTKHWLRSDGVGACLFLEPSPEFLANDWKTETDHRSLKQLLLYFKQYKKVVFQLLMVLLFVSCLNLLFPFLTQALVDIGIRFEDMDFIYLILAAQIAVFLGRTAFEFLRRWILLHVSTRIYLSMLTEFFAKLMRLPIAYFDTKMNGDILQRINDHKRLELLITSTSMRVLFSLFNLIVLGVVLAIYSWKIFAIFFISSLLYFGWVTLFLRKRKVLDTLNYQIGAEGNSKVIELVDGMQEIKLNNAERYKRWQWEEIQAKQFFLKIKNLKLRQSEEIGTTTLNEAKNVLILFVAATLTIKGEMTLGIMLSISFILGQLSAPLVQLVDFIHSVQDAKISLGRIAEIKELKDESNDAEERAGDILEDAAIALQNVHFAYTGHAPLFKGLNVEIPKGKLTAIVGVSGSGKTTLMKLLLRFYEPTNGNILFGNRDLSQIDPSELRNITGVVMQEGFIFDDTIAQNIAVGKAIDTARLKEACQAARILEYIESLPKGFATAIGKEGMNLSTGQKQRVLIARAIYKQPQLLFLDEATSALDTKNEKAITENLQAAFEGKTAVVIAHRLSTVRRADQIIVLDGGVIVEVGTHEELVSAKGFYFGLIKDQLELNTSTDE